MNNVRGISSLICSARSIPFFSDEMEKRVTHWGGRSKKKKKKKERMCLNGDLKPKRRNEHYEKKIVSPSSSLTRTCLSKTHVQLLQKP